MKLRKQKFKRFYSKKGGPRNIGLRCGTYCRGCIACDSYMFYYVNGRFGSKEEVRAAYPTDQPMDFEELSWAEAMGKISLHENAGCV